MMGDWIGSVPGRVRLTWARMRRAGIDWMMVVLAAPLFAFGIVLPAVDWVRVLTGMDEDVVRWESELEAAEAQLRMIEEMYGRDWSTVWQGRNMEPPVAFPPCCVPRYQDTVLLKPVYDSTWWSSDFDGDGYELWRELLGNSGDDFGGKARRP